MKAKSLEGLIFYVIRVAAPKDQGKCLRILAQVKTPLVREYDGTRVLETIDHDIIQLFDGNNMAQHSWRQLHNRNNPSKVYFTTTGIGKPCKPVLLLYTPSF